MGVPRFRWSVSRFTRCSITLRTYFTYLTEREREKERERERAFFIFPAGERNRFSAALMISSLVPV